MNPFRKTPVQHHEPVLYTEDQLMARLRFFIGVCLALTLTGIVFVVLYSIIFVTQPLNAMSPIDQKFFELIIPIATFLTGTLSGIMLAGKDDKEAKLKALEAATRPAGASSALSGMTTPAFSVRPMSAPMAGPGMPPPPPPPGMGPVNPAPPGPPNLPPPPVF